MYIYKTKPFTFDLLLIIPIAIYVIGLHIALVVSFYFQSDQTLRVLKSSKQLLNHSLHQREEFQSGNIKIIFLLLLLKSFLHPCFLIFSSFSSNISPNFLFLSFPRIAF